MYITYKHKGTRFHVAVCRNCEASVSVTDYQFRNFDHILNTKSEELNCLFLFDSVGCCSNPDFFWGYMRR